MKQSQITNIRPSSPTRPGTLTRRASGSRTPLSLMTLDRIKAMPVKDLSEENAHLYLWVPNDSYRKAWT